MKKQDTSTCPKCEDTIKISLSSPSDQDTDQKDAKLGREADWRDGRTLIWKPTRKASLRDDPDHD